MTGSETHLMLSMNEIDSLCQKAARGAGFDWGLAEEAGFAASWLAARGIDGAGALMRHLQAARAGGPVIEGRHWQSTLAGAMCPIRLGAALDDHAGLQSGPWAAPVTLAPARQPVLLAPFLARGAQGCAAGLRLTWASGTGLIGRDGEVAPALLAALAACDEVALTLGPAPGAEIIPQPPAPRPQPLSQATLAGLTALAMRTTVPASDQSRGGAGATGGDND